MFTQRLSRQDALNLLRHCFEEGIVQYHPHFHQRCVDRKVDPMGAQHVLRKGTIFDEPEFEVRFQQWRYKVEGKDPDGGVLKVVFTFLSSDQVLILTVLT
jgi:hypothetical protein